MWLHTLWMPCLAKWKGVVVNDDRTSTRLVFSQSTLLRNCMKGWSRGGVHSALGRPV